MDLKLKITWKFWVYLFVLILSAAPAVLVNTLLGYGPVLLVLLCGILSFVWLCLLRGKLDFDVNTDVRSCVRGEDSQFQVYVQNKGRLPAAGVKAVFFTSDPDGLDEQTTALRLTLAPREERSFGFSAQFPHIGNYRAGIRRMELSDILGIFRAVRSAEKSYSIEVLPRVAQVSSLPVTANVQTESTRATVQSLLNGSDYTGVREYAFGDPIKTIHWKLSAHAGGLMTKQMESYSNTGMSVVLNLQIPLSDGAARMDEFDAVIETGVAAGDYAARQGMDYDLLFYRQNGTVLRTVPPSFRSLHGIVEEMRLSEPSQEQDFVRLLRENCRGVYSQANIVVCTCVLTHELAEMLVNLKQGGRTPILFLILSQELNERERQDRTAQLRRLAYANIACRVLASAKELEV